MLHALVTARRARRHVGKAVWARCFALAALIFATPITQQAVTEIVTLLAQDDCGCEDDCKEHGECPGPCQTCFCCTHSNVTALATIDVPSSSSVAQRFEPTQQDGDPDGYAPHVFRPPTA